MGGAILGFLADNYPMLFVAAIVVIAVIVCTKKICKLYYQKVELMEYKINNLPCAQHSDNFKVTEEKLTKIITILTMRYPSSAAAFSIKRSPRQLNEKGKELYIACGGGKLLEDYGEVFLKLIEQYGPKTALDVETQAYDALVASQNDDMFNPIKEWVYNSPNWEIDTQSGKEPYEITMGDICFVISIPLRDMYLSKHPDILPED